MSDPSTLSARASTGDRSGKPAALSSPVLRLALVIGALFGLILVMMALLQWWGRGRFIEGTNDAYLRADQVTVAPKVQGYVDAVFVRDNQTVIAGQPLLRIDDSAYKASLAQQAATVQARRADIAAAADQIAHQEAVIDQGRAELSGARANAAYAGGEARRFQALSQEGVETQARATEARNQRDQATATVLADAALVKQAERQIDTLKAQAGQSQAQLQAAAAAARAATINLDDTLIRASISGQIGDKTVRVGQYVQPGTRLMSVVPVADTYLVANFKETQIGRMRIGQPATVKIDALGDRLLDARVESFSPGTGAEFALLPPENATGNFTKIVQRVPVRLRLLVPKDLEGRLLPGLSATVKVDTRAPERRP